MLRTYFDEKNKIWSGEKAAPLDPKFSLGQAILNKLKEKPDEIAQVIIALK